jgi:23S rRNA pseudouridine1911/1915/1917 synthase
MMDKTLLDHLLKLYPNAKRTTLRRMIQSRRVFVSGRVAATLKQPLRESDKVEVRDAPQPRAAGLPFRVVHEDDDILVIDKPAGLLTSTTPREKRTTALALVRNYIAEKNPKAQVGVMHRLDRDASGLLIFSKNHDAFLSLKRQFRDHAAQRIYLAIVHGTPTPPSGMIDSRLIERADGSVHSTTKSSGSERAITHYQTLEKRNRRSLLRVTLQTGKKHQIRVHLAERGVPIVGDPIYGEGNDQSRLLLAAVELNLTHPHSGRPLSLKIDPPPGFRLV